MDEHGSVGTSVQGAPLLGYSRPSRCAVPLFAVRSNPHSAIGGRYELSEMQFRRLQADWRNGIHSGAAGGRRGRRLGVYRPDSQHGPESHHAPPVDRVQRAWYICDEGAGEEVRESEMRQMPASMADGNRPFLSESDSGCPDRAVPVKLESAARRTFAGCCWRLGAPPQDLRSTRAKGMRYRKQCASLWRGQQMHTFVWCP